MKDKLITLSELGILLEYEDIRSTEKWCKKNNIPILTAGKQKYVPSIFVNHFFQNSINKFVSAKFRNPIEIMDAIENDNPIRLAELLAAPMDPSVKKEYKTKSERSKASQEFLNNIKTA